MQFKSSWFRVVRSFPCFRGWMIAAALCGLALGVSIPAQGDPAQVAREEAAWIESVRENTTHAKSNSEPACIEALDTVEPDPGRPEYSLPDDPTTETTQVVPPLTPERAFLLSRLQEPVLSDTEKAEILARYQNVDPGRVIPKSLRERALLYYDVNKRLIPNPSRLSVVDFSAESRKVRFHIIDMETGKVVSIRVAHGTGSDPDNTGFATKFSNIPQSKMSSLGFYLTAEEYKGEAGDARCRLDGLSATNSNVRPRAIVIHQADYVHDSNVKPGRSWGCLAVSVENHARVVKELKEGSLILGDLP